jgi:hypothetical protein
VIARHHLALCGLLGFVAATGCALAPRRSVGVPDVHTCYHFDGPESGAPPGIADGTWLLLTDESHDRFGARLYDGRLVSAARVLAVKWRRMSPDSLEIRTEGEPRELMSLRVIGSRAEGTLYAVEADRLLARGRVGARREPCESAPPPRQSGSGADGRASLAARYRMR